MAGIGVDAAGSLYLGAYALKAVQKITSGGIIATLAGQCGAPPGYVDGAGTAAAFSSPGQLTLDAAGNVYVVDTLNTAVRKITPAGVVSTVAKTPTGSGISQVATFGLLTGIALDPAGDVFLGDWSHSSIQEVTPAGVITTDVHNRANYHSNCGYDPAGLGTAPTVPPGA